MEKKGFVSIWLGNFEDENEFDNYIKEIYDEDGDVSSNFMKDYNIEYIDNQFQEVMFFNEHIDINILKNFSYSESFLSELLDINFNNSNSIILVYDFYYDEKLIKEKHNIKFIGTFFYNKFQ